MTFSLVLQQARLNPYWRTWNNQKFIASSLLLLRPSSSLTSSEAFSDCPIPTTTACFMFLIALVTRSNSLGDWFVQWLIINFLKVISSLANWNLVYISSCSAAPESSTVLVLAYRCPRNICSCPPYTWQILFVYLLCVRSYVQSWAQQTQTSPSRPPGLVEDRAKLAVCWDAGLSAATEEVQDAVQASSSDQEGWCQWRPSGKDESWDMRLNKSWLRERRGVDDAYPRQREQHVQRLGGKRAQTLEELKVVQPG